MRINAALLVIGDEILSGQVKDENIETIANFCTLNAIELAEVRIVADDENDIIMALNALRSRFYHVFTTGGIGPTHDDITAAAVAKSFGVELLLNDDAIKMMELHSGIENLSEARKRMARIPVGAELIKNTLTGAPGFYIGNVYVMAGVPSIMQVMLEQIGLTIETGVKIFSKKIVVGVGESKISLGLQEIQNQFENVKIGSYPQMGQFSEVVLRSSDKVALENAQKLVQKMVDKIHTQNNVVLPK